MKNINPNPQMYTLFTIRAQNREYRKPRDVVLVVDVSGSMRESANEKGEGETKYYSKLDVVKHALNTIVLSLSPEDRFSIIAFDSIASIIVPFTFADTTGVEHGLQKIKEMEAGGCTALWQAMKIAYQSQFRTTSTTTSSILLLTDGLPYPAMPMGELTMLQQFFEQNPHCVTIPMHCFGIGYNLDSTLLENVSQETGGTFNFIPDGGMVGTVMMNALANAGATHKSNVRMRVTGNPEVLGGLKYATCDESQTEIYIGDVQTIRHVLVKETNATCVFITKGCDVVKSLKKDDIAQELARCDFISSAQELLRVAKLNLVKAREIMNEFIAKHEKSNHPVLEDVYGQVTEALSREEYFSRWGVHYLKSLIGAHRDERCNNFKDVGIQGYKTAEFEEIRLTLSQLFDTIDAPYPSLHGSMAVGIPVGFAAFNNPSSGCFVPSTSITLSDGTFRRIDQLRKGDRVMTSKGSCIVRCLTKHVHPTTGFDVVTVNEGLTLTPWHPILIDYSWTFPAMLPNANVYISNSQHVWNIVLEEGYSVIFADGIMACTLGHGLTEAIVAHDYFGTNRVIDDLQKMDGWNDGLVTIRGEKRSEETGLVCQFV